MNPRQADSSPEKTPIRVALLGYGVVGRQVAALLHNTSSDLTQRVGAQVQLVGIAVRDGAKARDYAVTDGIDPGLITEDVAGLVAGHFPSTRTHGQKTHQQSHVVPPDVVVELMGGIDAAGGAIGQAIAGGSSVVTANKALLAQKGSQIFAAAQRAGVSVEYEAAVAGAIPVVRPLRESLVGDQVQQVLGIVNGTTNFILTCMHEQGMGYQQALELAQQAGYAEADPTADVQGYDSAAKAALLASLAFHTPVQVDQVDCQGITHLSAVDVHHAQQRDSVIKLLAIAQRFTGRRESLQDEPASQGITVQVQPVMVSTEHPLASVRQAFNAVFVQAAAAGQLMFYGPGAGGAPTASAVLGDIVAVARQRVHGSPGSTQSTYAALPVLDSAQLENSFHCHLQVVDRPGTLAAVAQVFAAHDVSLATVRQEGVKPGCSDLVVVTHRCPASSVQATVASLRQLDVVDQVCTVMPVLS